MGKCSWCNETKVIKSHGYCEDCYNTIRKSIAELKSELDALERRARLDLSPEEKQLIANHTIDYRNQLKVYKDRGVPFFKSSINDVCDNIYAKMGVEYRFPPDSVVGMRRKFSPLISGVFALCSVVIVTLAFSCYDLFEKNSALQIITDTERDINIRQAIQVAALQEQLAALQQPESDVAQTAPRSYTLQNGNFVSGKNFTPGTYNITAISGGGTVISDNLADGGIFALMGTEDPEYYEKKYSNINLPEGTTLTIDGVKVRLTLVE